MFCEELVLEHEGALCVLSVMRIDEPFSDAAINILRSREVVARERLRVWVDSRDL